MHISKIISMHIKGKLRIDKAENILILLSIKYI